MRHERACKVKRQAANRRDEWGKSLVEHTNLSNADAQSVQRSCIHTHARHCHCIKQSTFEIHKTSRSSPYPTAQLILSSCLEMRNTKRQESAAFCCCTLWHQIHRASVSSKHERTEWESMLHLQGKRKVTLYVTVKISQFHNLQELRGHVNL